MEHKEGTTSSDSDEEMEEEGEDDQIMTKDEKLQERRIEYLLKQSEVYAHFMDAGDAKVSADLTSLPKARKNEIRNSTTRAKLEADNKRLRKSEKEEDKELLEDREEEDDDEEVVQFEESPHYIKNGTMRDYQIRGLNWLINLYDNGINGILADEMGLGKTIQTISLFGFLKHYRGIKGHHLVIVPKSTLSNWVAEFTKWCPSITTRILIGDQNARKEVLTELKNLRTWEVLITSYEMILREKSALARINWKYMVIDEGHRIKNENSKLAEFVRQIPNTNRLLLTGTPLHNDLHELWALLNFLIPKVFKHAERFDSWFDSAKGLGDTSRVKRLHDVLRPFLLRRIKADVEKSLLPKKEFNIFVPLSPVQRIWYKKLLVKDIDILNGAGQLEKMRLLNIIMQLRKCTNHPYLFSGVEPGPPYTTETHLVNASGKLMVLDKLLPKLKAEGSRVLIFSQMTRMLDVLDDYCFWKKYKYCRLDGNTPHEERQQMINEFNAEGSETFIFMLSTRAGGLGINLATADVVIIYDSDWNPQMDVQAMDRAHRIGQTKQVRVFRLITEHTVEEKILQRAAAKLKLDRLVIQQGRLVGKNAQLNKVDMLSMIREGANFVLSTNDDEPIPDETIDAILERSKEKNKTLECTLAGLDESSLKTFNMDGSGSVYDFEGENYKNKSVPMVDAKDWIAPPKRIRKSVIYSGMDATGPAKPPKAKVKTCRICGRQSLFCLNGCITLKAPTSAATTYSYNQNNQYAAPTTYSNRSNQCGPITHSNWSNVYMSVSTNYSRPPRPEKLPFLLDFRFYPPRLREIFHKEILYYQHCLNYRPSLTLWPHLDGSKALAKQVVYQMNLDSATPVTMEEQEEKRELFKQGFTSWEKSDFKIFVHLLCQYGRENIHEAAKHHPGKSPEEVLKYNLVFWQRCNEIQNPKILRDILSAEHKFRFQLRAKAEVKIHRCDSKLWKYTPEPEERKEEMQRVIIKDNFVDFASFLAKNQTSIIDLAPEPEKEKIQTLQIDDSLDDITSFIGKNPIPMIDLEPEEKKEEIQTLQIRNSMADIVGFVVKKPIPLIDLC